MSKIDLLRRLIREEIQQLGKYAFTDEHEYFSVGPVIVSRVVLSDKDRGDNPWLMGI